MKITLILIHVVASVLLVVLILLHSGKGGGLSDMIGGSTAGSTLGGSTVVERNLNRITVVTAVTMFFTTVTLVILMRP